jgi:phage I-like protein
MPAHTLFRVQGFALCSELVEAPQGSAPEWVQLVPPGPRLQGRDGRTFALPDPQTVVDAFTRRIPFDCCHSTHYPGSAAPAVGWIEGVEVRDGGSIWGRVAWNARGKAHLEQREYSFVSPVLRIAPNAADQDAPLVTGLLSCALTNNPNLDLAALNHAQAELVPAPPAPQPTKGATMPKELLELLGLTEAATEAEITAALTALKARADQAGSGDAATAAVTAELNAARAEVASLQQTQPTHATHVPRADFDALRTELNAFMDRDRARETAAFDAQLNAILDDACKTQRMVPASRSHHERMFRALCQAEGHSKGLIAAREFFAASPPLVPPVDLSDARAANAAEAELTPEDREAIQKSGVSLQSFVQAKRQQASA